MTSYTISPIWGAGAQLFDNSGNVLTGGKIYTYLAGTTTPVTTYTTPTGSTANSNPIIANAAGRLTNEIWLTIHYSYKFVLKDANDVLIATYDNIPTLPQPAIVNDASSISYEQGYTVDAGNFTIGETYLITFVGTTDFTLIGASANTAGVHFVATGINVCRPINSFIEMSSVKSVFDISIQNTTRALFRSASTAASCASSSRTSFGCLIRPAQSNRMHSQCANEYGVLSTSLVVFRLCETILLSLPNNVFSRLLFPALVAPAIPTAGKSSIVSYLILPLSSSSSCPSS